MKKIMSTEVMRPHRRSGVMSCLMVWRMTVLTVSAAPEMVSIASDSQKKRERPKTSVAAP